LQDLGGGSANTRTASGNEDNQALHAMRYLRKRLWNI
jgi:hypothetical protein